MAAIYEREDSGAMFSVTTNARYNAVRSQVLKLSELRTFKRGEAVSTAGSTDVAMMTLSSGTLGVYADDGANGKVMFAPIFRGRVFNIIDIYNERVAYSMVALSTANVFFLTREKFSELEDDPAFKEWCTASVINNLSHLINFSSALRVSDIDTRILRILKACYVEMHEKPPEGDYEIEWQLKQQEFSSLLNITRPYLNERLKLLKQKGALVIENERAIVRPSLLSKPE